MLRTGSRRTRAVAVTGGIGAGKSTFCRICRAFPGVVHIDADRIVRALLAGSPPVWREIRGAFGRGVLGPDGRPDRTRMAARVFGQPSALRRLEAILHPRVHRSIARKVKSLKGAGEVAIVLAEIPLLVEVGIPEWCDLVVTIEADRAVRLARLRRRGMTAAAARRRMARQAQDRERRRAADLIIANNGDRAALEMDARRFWQRLCVSGRKRGRV